MLLSLAEFRFISSVSLRSLFKISHGNTGVWIPQNTWPRSQWEGLKGGRLFITTICRPGDDKLCATTTPGPLLIQQCTTRHCSHLIMFTCLYLPQPDLCGGAESFSSLKDVITVDEDAAASILRHVPGAVEHSVNRTNDDTPLWNIEASLNNVLVMGTMCLELQP